MLLQSLSKCQASSAEPQVPDSMRGPGGKQGCAVHSLPGSPESAETPPAPSSRAGSAEMLTL